VTLTVVDGVLLEHLDQGGTEWPAVSETWRLQCVESSDGTVGFDDTICAGSMVNGSVGPSWSWIKVQDKRRAYEANLAARQVTTHARIKAPGEGRATTRVNWLLRQLKGAPPDLRITAKFPRTRTTTSLLLSAAAAKPGELLLPDDPKREPSAFDVAMMRNMGAKRGKDHGSFVAETMEQVLVFYGEVLQNVRGWTRPPARLAEERTPIDESDITAEPESESTAPASDALPSEPPTPLAVWQRPTDL
jgi:hypothetical protein